MFLLISFFPQKITYYKQQDIVLYRLSFFIIPLIYSVYITAHLRETTEHNSITPNRNFQGLPDLQATSRNAWAGPRARKSPDASDNAHSAQQTSTVTYVTAFQNKPEIIQQEPIFGLEPVSEQSKTRVLEPPLGCQKRTLRSITSPLTAYRLKPIRQKTKKAVVCLLSFKVTMCCFLC